MMDIVLFINGISAGGGAERVVCNLANHLISQGNRVKILTFSNGKPAYPLNQDVQLDYLVEKNGHCHLLYLFYAWWGLRKYLKREDIDAIVTLLPVATILLLLCRRCIKIPIIVSERNNPGSYDLKTQKLLRKLYRRADGYVFQTPEALAWYSDVIDERVATIIPNAINEAFVHQSEFTGQRKREIVAVGRLTKQKNFPLLIETFAKARQTIGDYTLTIYGEGSQKKELEALTQQLGISDSVKLPGFATNIQEKIQEAALFVLSSDYEGMPNALIEAMALGLPCVATDCQGGGARFLIEDGQNGVLVPVQNAKALQGAICKVLSDKEFSQRLSKNALNIKRRLAPEFVYHNWETYILEVCSKRENGHRKRK